MASKKEHMRKKKAKRHPGKEEENPYSEIAHGVEINSLDLLSVFHGIHRRADNEEADRTGEEANADSPENLDESEAPPDAGEPAATDAAEDPAAGQEQPEADDQSTRTMFTIVLHKELEEATRKKREEEREDRERKRAEERERRRQLLLKVQQMGQAPAESSADGSADAPKPEEGAGGPNDEVDKKWREVIQADKALVATEEAKRRQDREAITERERQKAEEIERRRVWLEKAEAIRRAAESSGGSEPADAAPTAVDSPAGLGEEPQSDVGATAAETEAERQRRSILDLQQVMRAAKEKKRQEKAAEAAEQVKALAEGQERRRQWAEKAEQLRLAAERAERGDAGEEIPENVKQLLAEKKRLITGEKEFADTRQAVDVTGAAAPNPDAGRDEGEVQSPESGAAREDERDDEGAAGNFGINTENMHRFAEQAKEARLAAEEADRAQKKAEEQERRRQFLVMAEQARKREEEERGRIEQEEAERKRSTEAAAEEARRQAEAEEVRRREAEEARRRQIEAEEAERLRREEEEAELARKQAEEAERRREAEAEAERLRLKAEEAERLRREAEVEETRRREEEAAERAKREAEEAERIRREEEEAERLRLEAIEAERLRREAEEKELARRRAEAEERRLREEEEARRAEEEERHRHEEEAAELARREAEEAERRRREEEEAERQRQEAVEAERLRREAEERELERRRREAEERRRREEAEAEQARLEAEEAERRRREEEAAELARREAREAEERRLAEEKRREEERIRQEAIEAERKRQEAEAAELARRQAVEVERLRQEEAAEAARREREAAKAREREAEELKERRHREAEEALQAQRREEELERLRQEEEAAERARKMAEAVDRARRAAIEAERSRRDVEAAESRHRQIALEELRRREEEAMRQSREMAEAAERLRRGLPVAADSPGSANGAAGTASHAGSAPVLEVDNPYWETPREIFESLSGAPQGGGLPSYARVENEGTLPVTMPGGHEQPDAASRYSDDPVFGEGEVPAHRRESTVPVPMEKRMYIVMVTPEVAPCAKVGGLGDVVLGLGRELMKRGHGVEVICPMYAGMRYDLIYDLHEEYGELWCPHYNEWRQEKVFQGKVEGGLQVNFITGGDYTERPSIYGYDDDLQRFTYFSRQALEFMYKTNRRPDIIHCHDWSTGLVPAILWDIYQKLGWDNSRVVYTIHNNECQGLCGFGDKLLGLVGLDVKNYLTPDKMQDDTHRNCINMMKSGIVFSNFVTTVSPTYAGELKTAVGGRGLQTTIAKNSAKVGGVLNGIDYDFWNPQTDGKLASHYSDGDDFPRKYDNKKALRDWLGLWDSWKPIVSVVTRLTHQKGLDLIKQAIFQVQEMQGQFVLLGSAPDPKVNAEFLRIQHELKDNHDVNLYIGYHEDLSRLIYAGSDLFLIPSLYEPCGLTQMISLRYGTVPVARETGGLVDTVFDLDNSGLGLKDANGFTFRDPSPVSLRYGLERAIRLWYDNPEAFNRLARNGMRYDYSWRHPAEHYENIYNYIKA